jgi:transcriptional regulator with XRE-family HTH domain
MSEHSSKSKEYELCFRYMQLRSLRKLRKLSQEKLAKEIGIDQASVSLIERAETKISLDRLVDIAKALEARVVFDLEPKESVPLQPRELEDVR